MTELFFELIRIAIGTQERLSRVPSKKEWGRLFKMAERQRLLGICFYGVKKVASPVTAALLIFCSVYSFVFLNRIFTDIIGIKRKEGYILSALTFSFAYIMLAAIAPDHFIMSMCCLLATLYIFGREKAIEFADSIGQENAEWDYKHLHLKMFKDTEVEVHYRVEVLLNLWKNRKLQKWFKKHEEDMFSQQGGLITPTIEFNLFYILLHIYRHFLYEGVGLRQLLDYFFVLQEYEKSEECRVKSEELVDLLRQFGMLRFAQGVMWVLMHVFECQNESLTPTPSPEGKGIYDNDKPTPNPHPSLHSPSRSLPLKGRENLNWRERYPWMIVKPLESEGRFILHEVMQGGNFGKFDKRIKKGGKRSKLQAVSAVLQHNLHLLKHYPSDVIWAPIWIVYHWGWKKATVLKSNV